MKSRLIRFSVKPGVVVTFKESGEQTVLSWRDAKDLYGIKKWPNGDDKILTRKMDARDAYLFVEAMAKMHGVGLKDVSTQFADGKIAWMFKKL